MRWFGNPRMDAQTLNRYWHFCEGNPNGQIVASPGAICSNIEGGANTTLWVKESGNGSAGWVAK